MRLDIYIDDCCETGAHARQIAEEVRERERQAQPPQGTGPPALVTALTASKGGGAPPTKPVSAQSMLSVRSTSVQRIIW